MNCSKWFCLNLPQNESQWKNMTWLQAEGCQNFTIMRHDCLRLSLDVVSLLVRCHVNCLLNFVSLAAPACCVSTVMIAWLSGNMQSGNFVCWKFIPSYLHSDCDSPSAGLSAANHLQKLGFKVLVLEGHSRPGGRVHSVKLQVAFFPDT